jgi:hypothetical protein
LRWNGFVPLIPREKAEGEYQIDRQRINDDLDRAIDAIRRGRGSR